MFEKIHFVTFKKLLEGGQSGVGDFHAVAVPVVDQIAAAQVGRTEKSRERERRLREEGGGHLLGRGEEGSVKKELWRCWSGAMD